MISTGLRQARSKKIHRVELPSMINTEEKSEVISKLFYKLL